MEFLDVEEGKISTVEEVGFICKSISRKVKGMEELMSNKDTGTEIIM